MSRESGAIQKRFARHPANHASLEPIRQLPAPQSLDQILLSDIRELSAYRAWLDQVIIEWSRSITELDLECTLNYTSMKGAPADKSYYGLISTSLTTRLITVGRSLLCFHRLVSTSAILIWSLLFLPGPTPDLAPQLRPSATVPAHVLCAQKCRGMKGFSSVASPAGVIR